MILPSLKIPISTDLSLGLKTRTPCAHSSSSIFLSNQGFSPSYCYFAGNQNPKFPFGEKEKKKMTQKSGQFKGKQKKKSIPPNRHGKAPPTRKGKRIVKPSKITKEMDADRELSKFINHCNEVKAATVANKEGGQLSIVKPQPESTSGSKK